MSKESSSAVKWRAVTAPLRREALAKSHMASLLAAGRHLSYDSLLTCSLRLYRSVGIDPFNPVVSGDSLVSLPSPDQTPYGYGIVSPGRTLPIKPFPYANWADIAQSGKSRAPFRGDLRELLPQPQGSSSRVPGESARRVVNFSERKWWQNCSAFPLRPFATFDVRFTDATRDSAERSGSCVTMTATTTRRKHANRGRMCCCAWSRSSDRSSRASRGIGRAPTNSCRHAVSGSTRSGSSVVNRRQSSGGRRDCASESASPRSEMSGATDAALPRTRTASRRLRRRFRIPWLPPRPARCGCGLETPWSISRPSSDGC